MSRIGLYCRSDVIGGAERSMLSLAAAYRGAHTLVVLSPSRVVGDAVAVEAPDIEFHKFDSGSSMIDDIGRHRRVFAGADLDLVQVTLPNPFFARSAQLAAFSLRLPTVAVQQLVLAPRRRRGAWLVRVVARPLAATVAVGRQSADDLERLYGLNRERIHVVHNGVPYPAPPPVPGGLDRRPVIGCVARYEDQKGLDRLIRAMVDIPDARLVLVGHGSLRDDLRMLAAELGVADRVDVGPWRSDARQLIAAFDVFALASVDEAFPLTIVEAMLAGTPVVATDVGSVKEAVIDQETGLLVPSGDHDALVGAIRRLLDDRDAAWRLAAAARDLAESQYIVERMVDGYERVWESVLTSARDLVG